MLHQRGVLGGAAQAGGEGHAAAQRFLHVLRQAAHHRRLEQAGGDGDAADAAARQFARDRQGHADHRGLGGGVGGLADLAVVGGDGGGVDEDAALAFLVGGLPRHLLRGEADEVEAADDVDVEAAGEAGEGVRAFLAQHFFAGGDAGAVDQAVHRAEVFQRGGDRGLGIGFGGDVGADEAHRRAQFIDQRLSGDFVEIRHHHLAAEADQVAHGAGAEPGSAAGDDEYAVFDLHAASLRCGTGHPGRAAG